jgi:hypothetical protein
MSPAQNALLGLVLASLAVLGAEGQQLPPAPKTNVVTLNPQPGYFSEPSIAVNPRNPRQLVAAFQVPATAAYSDDAGGSWTVVPAGPADYKVSGDVSITYDPRGAAILCYIAFDKLGTTNYWAHGATRNGVFVRRSLDGGKTWEREAVPVLQFPTRPGIPFEDKPYIVADNTGGRYSGHLYVGWTEFTLEKSVILFSRSLDGGKTWSAPIEISSHEGLPRDDNGSVEGFTGVVGPDGTLYAVWADGNTIVFTQSGDGGRSFFRSRKIIDTAPSYFDVEDVARSNGFPQIAIDPRGRKRGGDLFVTWSDFRNGDVDVFCASSGNHGKKWSRAVRVNDDPPHDGTDQFFQWLAVDPADGAVNVIFYDRRHDRANLKTTVTLARSGDSGKTFRNYAWTTQSFRSHHDFIGDYTSIAALNGRVYGMWTEKPENTATQKGQSQSQVEKRKTVVHAGVAQF